MGYRARAAGGIFGRVGGPRGRFFLKVRSLLGSLYARNPLKLSVVVSCKGAVILEQPEMEGCHSVAARSFTDVASA